MIGMSWTLDSGQMVCRWSAAKEHTDSTPSSLGLTSSKAPNSKGAPQTAFPEVSASGQIFSPKPGI